MTLRAATPGVSASELGQPGGVATLDGSGHIPTSQMPVGDVTYLGNWNATTNTPTLANGVGTAGELYICDVAGSQNLGGGVVAYSVGDWVIYDGATWDRVGAAGAVPSHPTATIDLTVKNGIAPTFMRSDAAPALSQAIEPTWTSPHKFTGTSTNADSTVVVGGPNPVLEWTRDGQPDRLKANYTSSETLEFVYTNAAGTPVLTPFLINPAVVAAVEAYFKAEYDSSATDSTLTVVANLPELDIQKENGAANAKRWVLDGKTANELIFKAVSDDGSTAAAYLTVTRNGAAIAGIASNSGTGAWAHTGALSATASGGAAGLLLTTGDGGEVQALGNGANVNLSLRPKGTGIVTSYGNFSAPSAAIAGAFTVGGNSLTPIVGGSSRTAQNSNVSVANFYTVAIGGLYRVSAYVVLSQAATTSSVLPSASISYTEAVTGANVQDLITTTASTNTVGLHSGGSVVIQAQQGSNLSFITSNYASVGATPMQYAVHVTVEKIS